MELFIKFGWPIFWTFTPVMAVGIVLYTGDFKRKPIIGLMLFIAGTGSLILLSKAMIHEYGPMPWFPASTGTLHLATGLIFAACLGAILMLSTGSRKSKTLLAATSALGWGVWWFMTALFTACVMGDCL